METKKAGEHTQGERRTQTNWDFKTESGTINIYRTSNNNGEPSIRISAKGERGFTPIADVLQIVNSQELCEETIANARLIASAPTLKAENEKLKEQNTKMLEALEAISKVKDGEITAWHSVLTTLVLPAIKSAKGE